MGYEGEVEVKDFGLYNWVGRGVIYWEEENWGRVFLGKSLFEMFKVY